MSAKEMFEKLEYKQLDNNNYRIYYITSKGIACGSRGLEFIHKSKSGSYEFIGDSNITYADIYILLEFIRNQEQENKKYKEVINKLKKYLIDTIPDKFEIVDYSIKRVKDILKEVEHD